eukprot:CAMPEP_0181231790 /NCGR_PEP_ID=MMETSP1096-20121128/35321_1 /TAXON_ID=156174 ORGANISM="Chrysochromulina ericina, Strain CCMP281" /NCGR_SAMPLE_ID=MMETSP1096 /ASSEMBLY_ACC=CAM_ASM_000453 /LENGTH=56 /DNA_ID=CAMNT_0023325909 /DNA_START=208 /DNA_END=375 /DNA_ORIENTATION=+
MTSTCSREQSSDTKGKAASKNQFYFCSAGRAAQPPFTPPNPRSPIWILYVAEAARG